MKSFQFIPILLLLILFSQFKSVAQYNLDWTNYYQTSFPNGLYRHTSLLDKHQNLYTFSSPNFYYSNVSISKYNSHGNLIWQKPFTCSGNSMPTFFLASTDSERFIFCSADGYPATSCYYVMFDSSGAFLSTKYDTTLAYINPVVYGARMLIHDDSNYFYSSIQRINSANGELVTAIIKYDHNLNEIWRHIFHNAQTYYILITKVDPKGNVFVNAVFSQQNYLYKLDSSGILKWGSFLGDTINFNASTALDKEDNFYSCGVISAPLSTNPGYIQKVDSSGIIKWIKIIDGPNNENVYPYVLLPDSIGNLYVLAHSDTVNSIIDKILLLKLDSLGNEIWHTTYTGNYLSILTNKNYSNSGTALKFDHQGNLLLSGTVYNYNTHNDAFIINVDSAGTTLYNDIYSYTGMVSDSMDEWSEMFIDPYDNIYLTGKTDSLLGSSYAMIIGRYCKNICNTPVQQLTVDLKLNCYPNPSTFNINVALLNRSKGKKYYYSVYNNLGVKVRCDYINNSNSFVISKTELSAGIYFLEIREDDKVMFHQKIIFE